MTFEQMKQTIAKAHAAIRLPILNTNEAIMSKNIDAQTAFTLASQEKQTENNIINVKL